MSLLSHIRRWRHPGGSAEVATDQYLLPCACGQTLRGPRHATHQVVYCAHCRRPQFVLPLSPLPPVTAAGVAPSAARPAPATRPLPPWLMPLAAGTGTFVLAALGFWVLVSYLLAPGARPVPTMPVVDLEPQLDGARRALLAGDFAQAARQLEGLQTAAPAQRRRLVQLQRQAALLSEWPREPLELILARTNRLNDEEWQAVTGRYRGKAAVFDVVVRRDASRQYWVKSLGPAGVVTVNLDVQNVKLLEHLPLDGPQRLLLAGRIAELRRTGPEACLVRLDGDGAALLTDINAAGLGNLIPEATLSGMLAQQQKWVDEMP